jgi:hypothetical protein
MCKAVVQVGPNKGKQCEREASIGEYCGRHERNKLYDEGIASGVRWCRFFFRGCDSKLGDNPKAVSCDACIAKLRKNAPKCQHDGCKSNAKENESFCGKHERDKYRVEEQERGIKYCDIARGCFNVCEGTFKSCKECLEKERATDSKRKSSVRSVAAVAKTYSDMRVCIKCTTEYTPFNTKHEKESTKCKTCYDKQTAVESERERERNYRSGSYNALNTYYNEYMRSAKKRNEKPFELSFDEFAELVNGPCEYCDHKVHNEVNGIDRVDNEIGYILSNCVSCCKTCNRMKHAYHPLFFIQKAHIIAKNEIPSSDFYKTWECYYNRFRHAPYEYYKREAEERNLAFNLSKSQYNELLKSPCYICNATHTKGNGIDRVDNSKREYSYDNCKACCTSCNNMKHTLSHDELLDVCKKIAEKHPM